MSRRVGGWNVMAGAVLLCGVFAAGGEALGAMTIVGDGSVGFHAEGPAGLKIRGTSSGIRTSESQGKVTIVAPTTDFKTGIGLRDRHLKEYLESETHPTAELVVDRAQITLPSGGAPASGSLTAPLTLHGVTKPVRVDYRITPAGGQLKVHGDIDLKIQDFGIKKPCYLGVCVGDQVHVDADFAVSAPATSG